MSVSIPTVNGTPKARKGKTEAKPATFKAPSTYQIRWYATVAMGVFIPLLSLGLSHTGGNLLKSECLALAGFAFGLMGCVLAVSLSHLAWGVQDITKSATWASWLLAIAFDLCLVLGELVHVNAEEAGIGMVVTAIMVCVCGLSMFLNCWAFLRHKAE